LTCTMRTGSCAAGEELVVSLSDTTNAHLANDSSYPNLICCSPETSVVPPVVITDLYWADTNGDVIIDQDVNIGDTVQLIAQGYDSGTFNIIEEDLLVDNDIKDIAGAVSGASLIGSWKITAADLDKADNFDAFYFKVDNGDEESNRISISGSYSDDPMIITIVGPYCGQYFDEGDVVSIQIDAADKDDFIWGNVTINGVLVNTFGNGGVTFNKTFDVAGRYTVVAEAINSRGKRNKHIANIMVLEKNGDDYVDRKYVAACISKPKNYANIETSLVEFDASTTTAVDVVGGNINVITPDSDPTRFSWLWSFYPDGVTRSFIGDPSPLAYLFSVKFAQAGDNSASLQVDFD
jgi:hypothetical protein